MKVSMDLLKQLREATFAPLKDCKDALVESEGDLDQAMQILKEKGILKAGKKADRETNEGLVKVVTKDGWTAGIKLLCETDFVAKNETFLELLDVLLDKLVDSKQEVENMDALNADLLEDINNTVAGFIGKIGENVQLGDAVVSSKKAFGYNHPGNKVVSIVYFDGEGYDVAKEVALQVAAMNPTYLSVDSVPQNYYNELKEQAMKEVAESGKPANIVEQIVNGKMGKILSEFVLLEQEYIRDGSKKIKDILPEGFEVKAYTRLSIHG